MAPERFAELDAERLGVLFAELDAELAGRREPIEVLVAGGAALAFKWSDRSTYDVDLIGGDFPAEFRGPSPPSRIATTWNGTGSTTVAPSALPPSNPNRGRCMSERTSPPTA